MSTEEKVNDKMDEVEEHGEKVGKRVSEDVQQLGGTKIRTEAETVKATVNGKGHELSTKDAYFASLNEWVKHANISQNAMALFPWYLMNSYPQIFQNQLGSMFATPAGSTLPPLNNNPLNLNGINGNAFGAGGGGGAGIFHYRIMSEQMQMELIQRTGGYEYVIAPFGKRLIAEMIDMVILFVLKIVITFSVVNLFDLDLGFDLDKEMLRKAIEDDDYTSFLGVSMDFLAFSSDLIMLEIFTKIIVCFYEAIWTVAYNGATPGKAAMHLRIQYVEAIYPLPGAGLPDGIPQIPPLLRHFPGIQSLPINALIYPAEVPSFQRAFMRAVAKNMIMSLFFPMCFILIFFKNNRTAYDVVTKTIVVEANPNPVLRRPPLRQ